LEDLFYDTTRNKVHTTRMVEVEIKKHRGWKYVNYGGRKIGINSIQKTTNYTDYVFDYIFGGGSEKYPCSAMEFLIYRHRLGHEISTEDYKNKFNVKLKN